MQEWEDRLRAEGYEPGHRVSHCVLRNMRPAHALVREWTQADELGLLREETQRLRQVLGRALEALRRAADEQAIDLTVPCAAGDIAARGHAQRQMRKTRLE